MEINVILYVGNKDGTSDDVVNLTRALDRFLNPIGRGAMFSVEGPTGDTQTGFAQARKMLAVLRKDDERHPGYWPMFHDPADKITEHLGNIMAPITINGRTLPMQYLYTIQQILTNFMMKQYRTASINELFFTPSLY